MVASYEKTLAALHGVETGVPMKEFDPECEVHRPVIIVKAVNAGCALELQIENCATGRVKRLTTTESEEIDVANFEREILASYREAWATIQKTIYDA